MKPHIPFYKGEKTLSFLNTTIEKCHCNLLQKKSKLPLAYLVSRGINFEEIKKYKIGYIATLMDNPIGEDDNTQAFNKWIGVRGKYVQHRLVFPIYNESGQILGLETRALDRRSLGVLKKEYLVSCSEAIEKLPSNEIRYKKFYLEEGNYNTCFFGLPMALHTIWEKKRSF